MKAWEDEIMRAHDAAEAAGLYDTFELYAVLCDLSEHIMFERGESTYERPDVMFTSPQARRSASDIVAVIKEVTGFDLMDPARSLARMRKVTS